MAVVFNELVGHVMNLKHFEQLFALGAYDRVVDVVETRDETHKLASGQFVVEERCIRNVPQHTFCFDGVFLNIDSMQGSASGGRTDEAGEHLDGRCFSRAIGTEKAKKFAFLDA